MTTMVVRGRFSLGRVVATPGALEALGGAKASAVDLLVRHVLGDWGDVDEQDWQANEWAVKNGSRILSAYTLSTGERIWLITEADRSSSCLLLPSDY